MFEIGQRVRVKRPADFREPPSWRDTLPHEFTGVVIPLGHTRQSRGSEWTNVKFDPGHEVFGLSSWYCDNSWVEPMGGPW